MFSFCLFLLCLQVRRKGPVLAEREREREREGERRDETKRHMYCISDLHLVDIVRVSTRLSYQEQNKGTNRGSRLGPSKPTGS
ncbi:hypothetical protein F4778DRAFT_302977 [Xylariomycetidae sp. FL2044]|nr:hypothetical protein F4778DRAFT_302977 [Xylariomycetidae sp. FL2044]